MDTLLSGGAAPVDLTDPDLPIISGITDITARSGGENYGRYYVTVSGAIEFPDGSPSIRWYRLSWGASGLSLDNVIVLQGSSINVEFGLDTNFPELVPGNYYDYEVEVLSDNPALVSPAVLFRTGRRKLLIPITTNNLAISTPAVTVNTSNPAQITARVEFAPLDTSGAPVFAQATTRFGPSGVTPLPYAHISAGEEDFHSQILPYPPANQGTNGPYLTPGDWDFQTTLTDSLGETFVGPLQTFTVDGAAFGVDDPVITLDTSNLNEITAKFTFEPRDSAGNRVVTSATTYWGYKGTTLNYQHVSPGSFDRHEQLIPAGTPNVGNNGPYLIPGREYDYYQVITDGTDTITTDVTSFKVPGGGASTGGGGNTFDWNNNETPPALSNVQKFVGKDSLAIAQWSGNEFNCAGPYYRVSGSASEDAFIDLREQIMTIPLWVSGFRNVIVLGGTWEIGIIPGCGIGQKKMWTSGRGANYDSLHPHMPANRIIHTDCTDVSWIEGVNANANGNATDFHVTNGSLLQSETYSRQNRWAYIINCRARGWEGVTGPSGLGFHGDFVQNQQLRLGRNNAALYRRSLHGFVCENSTSLSGMSHASLGQDDAFSKIRLRNVYFDMDPQIAADQNGIRGPEGSSDTSPDEQKGPAMYTRLVNDSSLEVENVVYRTQRHSNTSEMYGFILGERAAGRYIYASKYLDGTPTGFPSSPWSDQMRIIPGDCYNYMSGPYPSPVAECDFAPDEYTGHKYVAPSAYAAIYASY